MPFSFGILLAFSFGLFHIEVEDGHIRIFQTHLKVEARTLTADKHGCSLIDTDKIGELLISLVFTGNQKHLSITGR